MDGSRSVECMINFHVRISMDAFIMQLNNALRVSDAFSQGLIHFSPFLHCKVKAVEMSMTVK